MKWCLFLHFLLQCIYIWREWCIISFFNRFQRCWILRGGCFSFFVLQMVRNMTQIIIRGFVLSRFSMIWFGQHIAATDTGTKVQYIQERERQREYTGYISQETAHTKVGMIRLQNHSRFVNEDVQRFSASVLSSQINAALKWVIVRHFEDIG